MNSFIDPNHRHSLCYFSYKLYKTHHAIFKNKSVDDLSKKCHHMLSFKVNLRGTRCFVIKQLDIKIETPKKTKLK